MSDGQSRAKAAIELTASVTDGVSASMVINHGPICAASIAALEAANMVRDGACAAMATVSQDLAEKMTVAASQYDQTDYQAAADIDKEMHPR
ncbi:hypothetical protein JOF57_004996 [Mycolicibacterium lutetiense]|uniref:ESX-1 secretion-associated protein n=1 Tax=Mycolicibacterium lutetiense TaxID=1641992 RepID=A0ABS5A004_9MYCO|nr:hypothetical protein [Mycolicibacterium lutetiense]